MSEQFPVGKTITITAVVDNAEGQPVSDTLSWTTTSGTVTADATGLVATLTDAALGTVTVTATDPNGLAGSVTFDVIDATPSSITLTATAA